MTRVERKQWLDFEELSKLEKNVVKKRFKDFHVERMQFKRIAINDFQITFEARIKRSN